MTSTIRRADELTRRRFMSRTAQGLLGVGLLPASSWAQDLASGSGNDLRRKPTARNVIYLYMSGGMTHLDTLDPKPGHENGGPVKAIPTSADGVMISEYLPLLAGHMHKAAIVRSLTSTQGAHQQGNYLMHSSYNPRGTITHPGLGAWLCKLDGHTNRALPGFIRLGGNSRGGGGGFMESQYQPLVLGGAGQGLANSVRPEAISEQDYNDRLMLADAFDESFHGKFGGQKAVHAQKAIYDDAVKLMKSEDLKAFDLTQESEAVREEYGENGFGQGCLLARRLLENDVRFVEVNLGGWDTHSNNFPAVAGRAATLDQAISALFADLTRRGMLDETLVVLATEFGRTPRINGNNGRDHFPKVFSCMLAGGGIKGGTAYGLTSEGGDDILEGKVTVPDFNATIAAALGLPLDRVVHSPSGRPFTIAHKGRPITELLG